MITHEFIAEKGNQKLGHEKAWAVEVEQRIDQTEAGDYELIPGDEVVAEIRKRLKT